MWRNNDSRWQQGGLLLGMQATWLLATQLPSTLPFHARQSPRLLTALMDRPMPRPYRLVSSRRFMSFQQEGGYRAGWVIERPLE